MTKTYHSNSFPKNLDPIKFSLAPWFELIVVVCCVLVEQVGDDVVG